MGRFQSFGTKLLLLFVLVVAAAQFATYFAVSRANRTNARALIAQDLGTAGGVFRQIVAERNDILATGASAATSDYAFKSLVARASDAATVASALSSVRLRIRADLVTLLSLEATPVASTAAGQVSGEVLKQLVTAADADASDNPRATGYGYLDGQLYSLVTAPVRAPDIVAWIVVGFRIDNKFAQRLKGQARVDVTFADQDARILATTLPLPVAQALSGDIPRLRTQAAVVTLPLAGESSMVSTSTLPAGGNLSATLVLQYSLDEKLRPARQLERLLLVVACGSLVLAGLLGSAFARQLGRPVEALAAHTRVIAGGDYATRIELRRSDELGRLAAAFNQMSAGLAERDRVRDLLDKNVSPEVAAQLMRDGAALGGEEREVTVLFADLRNFTSLSEKLPPREVLVLLNRYLDRMSAEIERHGGVIDKFIGDEIMALFGAPVAHGDDADRALSAALAMQAALAQLNGELAAEGRPPLAIGIGLNTARVVAGNMGSARRLNYSVIGDGVNVAARLQSLTRNPEYHASILLSGATLRSARGHYRTRPLGNLAVKGRAEPVTVLALDPT
ncbi:MAG TPA: adenylate/guanylate cyclase domain-containing protein [Opitutaceae bacterium]|nr:adenylate/guanylate cyclase domain-containing protein [Opitutaceae bacterium]